MPPRAPRLPSSARAEDSDEDLVDDSSRLRAAIASATAPSACGVRASASTFSIVVEDAASRRPATDAHTAVMRALEANLQLQRTCRTQLTMIERALQHHERTRIRMDDMAADCAADQGARIQRVINARWRPTVQPLLPSDPSVRPPPTADARRRAELHAAVPLQPPREWATSMPWCPAERGALRSGVMRVAIDAIEASIVTRLASAPAEQPSRARGDGTSGDGTSGDGQGGSGQGPGDDGDGADHDAADNNATVNDGQGVLVVFGALTAEKREELEAMHARVHRQRATLACRVSTDDVVAVLEQLSTCWPGTPLHLTPRDWERIAAEHVPQRTARECQIQWSQRDDPRLRPFFGAGCGRKKATTAAAAAATAAAEDDGDGVDSDGAPDAPAAVARGAHGGGNGGGGRASSGRATFARRGTDVSATARSDVPFDAAEEAALQNAIEVHGLHAWEMVAAALSASGFPGRTPMACHRFWAASKMDKEAGHIRRSWSVEEDEALRRAVERVCGVAADTSQWVSVATILGTGRSSNDCLERWRFALKPGLKKGPWTAEEDAKLRELVAVHGAKDWASWCPQHMGGRPYTRCRERWQNRLATSVVPHCGVDAWTPEEDAALRHGVETHGKSSWAAVAKTSELLARRGNKYCRERWVVLGRKARRERREALHALEDARAVLDRTGLEAGVMVHEVEGVFEAWQEGAPTADVAGTRPPAPPRPALPLVPEIPQWLIDEAAERRDAEKEQQERQRLALTALSGNDGAGAGNDGAVSGNDGAGDDDDGDDGGGSSGRDRPASGRKRRRPPNRDVAAMAAAAIAAASASGEMMPTHAGGYELKLQKRKQVGESSSSTGYEGVSYVDRRKKFDVKYRHIYIGTFGNAVEGALARAMYAQHEHPEAKKPRQRKKATAVGGSGEGPQQLESGAVDEGHWSGQWNQPAETAEQPAETAEPAGTFQSSPLPPESVGDLEVVKDFPYIIDRALFKGAHELGWRRALQRPASAQPICDDPGDLVPVHDGLVPSTLAPAADRMEDEGADEAADEVAGEGAGEGADDGAGEGADDGAGEDADDGAGEGADDGAGEGADDGVREGAGELARDGAHDGDHDGAAVPAPAAAPAKGSRPPALTKEQRKLYVDCGECDNCLDKPKFGGPKRRKMACSAPKLKGAVAGARDGRPQPLTPDEARAAAAAEGLELVPAFSNKTGFKGVSCKQFGKYDAMVRTKGTQIFLGTYATPEEAALHYARHIGKERAAAEAAEARDKGEPQTLTADEAKAAAAAEGLELVLSSSSETGFKGVRKNHGKYRAVIKENGKERLLGNFATPEEAALHYARHIGKERAAAEAAEARAQAPRIPRIKYLYVAPSGAVFASLWHAKQAHLAGHLATRPLVAGDTDAPAAAPAATAPAATAPAAPAKRLGIAPRRLQVDSALTAAVSSLDEEPTALPVGDPTLDALLANRRRNTALVAAAAAAAAAAEVVEVEEEEEEEEQEDAVPTGAPTPLDAFKQGPCDIQAGCTLPKWHRCPCSVPETFSLPRRQKKAADRR